MPIFSHSYIAEILPFYGPKHSSYVMLSLLCRSTHQILHSCLPYILNEILSPPKTTPIPHQIYHPNHPKNQILPQIYSLFRVKLGKVVDFEGISWVGWFMHNNVDLSTVVINVDKMNEERWKIELRNNSQFVAYFEALFDVYRIFQSKRMLHKLSITATPKV
jgi:hypothetical protein